MKLSYRGVSRKPGPRALANEKARRETWPAVLKRSGYRCEGCGRVAGDVALQWAHVAGRPGSGATLGEWANSVELTMALCADDPATGMVGCHTKYDRHADARLRSSLGREAVFRLVQRVPPSTVKERDAPVAIVELGRELDAIRSLVRELEARGIEP